jgi:hypothetical protein
VRERAERRRLARNVVPLANVLGGFRAAEEPLRVVAIAWFLVADARHRVPCIAHEPHSEGIK